MNFRKEDDGQERGVENQKLNFFFLKFLLLLLLFGAN